MKQRRVWVQTQELTGTICGVWLGKKPTKAQRSAAWKDSLPGRTWGKDAKRNQLETEWNCSLTKTVVRPNDPDQR